MDFFMGVKPKSDKKLYKFTLKGKAKAKSMPNSIVHGQNAVSDAKTLHSPCQAGYFSSMDTAGDKEIYIKIKLTKQQKMVIERQCQQELRSLGQFGLNCIREHLEKLNIHFPVGEEDGEAPKQDTSWKPHSEKK